ncbi:hypothetical protein HDE_14387 [Halotydeus destructor]|nr:hypothetical protein HDE_14387 [Halotydeus destructor]
MKSIVFGAFVAFAILCVAKVSHAQSTCHLRELDLCAATLIVFAQSPTGAALGDDDLDKQCTYIREAETCLRNYTSRCATPLQKDMLGFLTDGSLKLMDQFCTRGSKLRTSYLKHAGCLNQVTRNGATKPCIKDLQAAFEEITTAKFDKRIPTGCCAFRKMSKCTEALVSEKCGKDSVDFMKQLMRMALSRMPDIVCQDYAAESQTCKQLLPPPGAAPKQGRSTSVLSRLFSAYTGM